MEQAKQIADDNQPKDDALKFEDESYLNKLRQFSEKLGLSIDEIKEKQITKTQLKKMLKEKVYKTRRVEKRKDRLERRRVKKREQMATGNYVPPPARIKMQDSASKLKIAIDLSLETYMNVGRDLIKTFRQVGRCYSQNRTSKEPCQLYLTSFNGRIKDEFNKLDHGMNNWDVHFVSDHWYEFFKSTNELSKIVFLTPDSENVLPDAETMVATKDESIYIIGGLVDHNFHSNLTLNKANQMSIKTAKLPIDQCDIKMKMSKVLSINQVFEIMLEICTGAEWKDTLLKNLPQRKLANGNEDKEKKKIRTTKDSNSLSECSADDKLPVNESNEKVVQQETEDAK